LTPVTDATVGIEPRLKPRLRGVSHQYAFFVALAAGAALVAAARGAQATVAVAVYALSLCAMFGTSALYHRIDWPPRTRRWMRRLDHSMIFVLIAGTYTPFAAVVLGGDLGLTLLVVIWGGALAGVVLTLVWPEAPRRLVVGVCIALGWIAVGALPEVLERVGPAAVVLLGAGGLLYTVGAVVYAVRRPDPAPAVFGYHEIFHVFVIAAALAHFVAVGLYGLGA
jgi:hemolysin III